MLSKHYILGVWLTLLFRAAGLNSRVSVDFNYRHGDENENHLKMTPTKQRKIN